MKNIILLLLTLVSEYSFSQQAVNQEKKSDRMFLGFSAGALLSSYFQGSENDRGGLGTPTNYTITYEKNPTAGFTAGCFADLYYKPRFSLRLDINYLYSRHHIKYVENIGGASSTSNSADYEITGSVIQFSLLPKFTLGEKKRIYILLGPYIDIRAFSTIKGKIEKHSYNYSTNTTTISTLTNNEIKERLNNTVGPLVGLGVNVPLKENYFCVESKLGYGFGNVITSPNMRQLFITLNIIYQLKL
ncbi:MAG: outer membrane beta-barrel protein [Bacteroidia bacterium]